MTTRFGGNGAEGLRVSSRLSFGIPNGSTAIAAMHRLLQVSRIRPPEKASDNVMCIIDCDHRLGCASCD